MGSPLVGRCSGYRRLIGLARLHQTTKSNHSVCRVGRIGCHWVPIHFRHYYPINRGVVTSCIGPSIWCVGAIINHGNPALLQHVTTFRDAVLAVVATIPKGQVLTYKQVATLAGSPNAYRAVGQLMKQNHAPNIPCHRVITSSGHIGHYNRGGTAKKRELLKNEGIQLTGNTLPTHYVNCW